VDSEFLCNVNDEDTCVATLDECINFITGCPVTKPIKCNNKCVENPSLCFTELCEGGLCNEPSSLSIYGCS
jgi:hypothetical protein